MIMSTMELCRAQRAAHMVDSAERSIKLGALIGQAQPLRRNMNRGSRTLIITEIQVHDLPYGRDHRPRPARVQLKLASRQSQSTQLTPLSETDGPHALWKPEMQLRDVQPSACLTLSILRHHKYRPDERVCQTEIPVDQLDPDKSSLERIMDTGSFNKPANLILYYNLAPSATSDSTDSGRNTGTSSRSSRPSADLKSTARNPGPDADAEGVLRKSSVPDPSALCATVEGFSSAGEVILENIAPIHQILTDIAKIHPIASAAWSLLTAAYNILLIEKEKTKKVKTLYNEMIKTYKALNLDDILPEIPRAPGHNEIVKSYDRILTDMVKQTTECTIFIHGYISGSFFARLTDTEVDERVHHFTRVFLDLRETLESRLERMVVVYILKAYSSLESQGLFPKLQVFFGPRDQPTLNSPCLPGTRQNAIDDVLKWFNSDKDEVLWLTGPLGSGKTALVSTIASAVRSCGRLGASVSFAYGDNIHPIKKDTTWFINTLTIELGLFDSRVGTAIIHAVESNPNYRMSSVHDQYEILVKAPLRKVQELGKEGPVLIVIDALDECAFGDTRSELLNILSQGLGPGLGFVRLMVVSRRAADITYAFDSANSPRVKDLFLDVQSEENIADVRTYFECKVQKIKEPSVVSFCHNKRISEALTKRADGVFLWAFLAWRYFAVSPRERYKKILDDSCGDVLRELDPIYERALKETVCPGGQEGQGISEDDMKEDLSTILGAVAIARSPPGLTGLAIDELLFRDPPKTHDLLRRLQCIFRSKDSLEPILFIHESLYNFLLDKQWSQSWWWIDGQKYHKILAMHCLTYLKERMRKLRPSSTLPDTDVDDSSALSYACLYWMDHASQAGVRDEEIQRKVHKFFQKYVLTWLHITLLLGKAYIAIKSLDKLLASVALDHPTNHLLRIALSAAEALTQDSSIKSEPGLIYTRSLDMAQTNRDIAYIRARMGMDEVMQEGDQSRACRHTGSVTCVAFSSDGSRVASASAEGAIHVWDAHTGFLFYNPMTEHTGAIRALAFSRDGKWLASGSEDTNVRIWSAVTGKLFLTFTKHSAAVLSLAISPDGSQLASGGQDNVIYVTNMTNGELISGPLVGHGKAILSLAFTEGGVNVVSGSSDEVVYIWDTRRRTLVGTAKLRPSERKRIPNFPLPPAFTSRNVRSVTMAVSPSGLQAMSSSGELQMFATADIYSGKRTTLEEFARRARAFGGCTTVAFSWDSGQLVAGYADGSVCVWDTNDQLVVGRVQGHKEAVLCVAFARDGKKVVSGSEDQSVRVWNIASGGLMLVH